MKAQAILTLICLVFAGTVNAKIIPSHTERIVNRTYCFYPNGVLPMKVMTPAYSIEENNGRFMPQLRNVAVLCVNRPDINLLTINNDFTVPEFIEADGELIPVTAIDDMAFYGSMAENIAIHDNVSRIGMASFQNASRIKKLTLPAALNFIGEKTFSGMNSLESVCFRSFLPPVCVVTGSDKQTIRLSVASELQSGISDEDISLFDNRVIVKVPRGSKWLYKLHPCFAKARLLEYIPEYGIPTLSANDVSGFGFGYAGNGELTVISSQGGSEVNIPSLLQSEDYQMGISMNETPYEVRYVAGGICDSHSEVTTILIPSSVIAIGSDAFRGTRAASITIPAGVRYIGPRAFGDDSSLKRLIIRRDENSPELLCAPDAFSGSAGGATLYIDTNLVDVTEAPWNEFTDIRSISELH